MPVAQPLLAVRPDQFAGCGTGRSACAAKTASGMLTESPPIGAEREDQLQSEKRGRRSACPDSCRKERDERRCRAPSPRRQNRLHFSCSARVCSDLDRWSGGAPGRSSWRWLIACLSAVWAGRTVALALSNPVLEGVFGKSCPRIRGMCRRSRSGLCDILQRIVLPNLTGAWK